MHKRRRKQRSSMAAAKEKELVNSKNPHYPFIYLLGEGTWAATWRKERKRQPTNGQRNTKITALPMKRYTLSKDDV
jgi:hypothetical protein